MPNELECWEPIKWGMVEAVFRDGSPCDSCSYLHTWEERHPYGSTTAAEIFSECKLLDDGPVPDECPGFASWMDELREDLEYELERAK